MRELQIDRILVPTDLSEPGLIALRYARFLAGRFSAGLMLVYAEPMIFPGRELGVLPAYVSATPEHVNALELRIRTYAEETLRGLTYIVAATDGDPVPSIVHKAKESQADLIVMATHGLRGWRRAILGSVTERVLHEQTCPVISISRSSDQAANVPPSITKILCPINFTPAARVSLEYAARLAAAFECELVVVHVTAQQDAIRARAAEEDVREWMGVEMLNRCSVRQLVLRGGPAERVLDCAEDLNADLMVIGAQHKMFRDVTTIGTTTERIVRFAKIPVLTVPVAAIEAASTVEVERV